LDESGKMGVGRQNGAAKQKQTVRGSSVKLPIMFTREIKKKKKGVPTWC